MSHQLTDIEIKFLSAAYEGELQLLNQLLPQLKSIHIRDADGMTPLWYAVIENQEAVIDFLMKNGSNINETDNYDNTLIEAIKTTSMLNKLISYGLDIHQFETQKYSPLYMAIAAGHIEVSQELINLGVSYQHLDFNDIRNINPISTKAVLEHLRIIEEKEKLERNIAEKIRNKSNKL